MPSFALRFVGQEALPSRLSEFDRDQFFELTPADVAAIRDQFRTDHRLPAALMVMFMRVAGRPLNGFNVLPRNLLKHTARMVGVAPPSIAALRSPCRAASDRRLTPLPGTSTDFRRSRQRDGTQATGSRTLSQPLHRASLRPRRLFCLGPCCPFLTQEEALCFHPRGFSRPVWMIICHPSCFEPNATPRADGNTRATRVGRAMPPHPPPSTPPGGGRLWPGQALQRRRRHDAIRVAQDQPCRRWILSRRAVAPSSWSKRRGTPRTARTRPRSRALVRVSNKRHKK
ncbi:DUF4158 domain-containing protein [Variovorax sp. LjRoot175]|uniref:DUF4158 domain-containing protein n=1 Tax=Variovorax sp. LjRoot175 TaxID=3342276 RepID=UPI003F51393E